jgi:hypothetical protein
VKQLWKLKALHHSCWLEKWLHILVAHTRSSTYSQQ